MATRHALGSLCALLLAGCTASTLDESDGTSVDGPSVDDPDPGAEDPGQQPLDDEFSSSAEPEAVDDGYIPKTFASTRFGVFYQVTRDVLDAYQDLDTGLPKVAGHAWLITQSHATAYASKTLADLVHRRDDFYYAPAFDLWDAKHKGWLTTTDAQLRAWAHDFRDKALAAHADLFTLNEAPTSTGDTPNVRVRIAKLLRFIHEPDAQGRRLWGVTYLTERAATPSYYTSAASDFFKAIDDTSVAMVVEHYHSHGFMCGLSETELAQHFFAFRKWLVASGEPAKLSIANRKYTVLHSARFEDGTSGWAGADATKTTLAAFQRALSRVAKVTRQTEGGVNRISFAPTSSNNTRFGVHPRLAALLRWHYRHTGAQASELSCIDNYGGNCTCQ